MRGRSGGAVQSRHGVCGGVAELGDPGDARRTRRTDRLGCGLVRQVGATRAGRCEGHRTAGHCPPLTPCMASAHGRALIGAGGAARLASAVVVGSVRAGAGGDGAAPGHGGRDGHADALAGVHLRDLDLARRFIRLGQFRRVDARSDDGLRRRGLERLPGAGLARGRGYVSTRQSAPIPGSWTGGCGGVVAHCSAAETAWSMTCCPAACSASVLLRSLETRMSCRAPPPTATVSPQASSQRPIPWAPRFARPRASALRHQYSRTGHQGNGADHGHRRVQPVRRRRHVRAVARRRPLSKHYPPP